MSNVYTRNRKKTPFDVLANAEKLQDLVTLYVMNERYVPKKWRFMIGQDLIKKIDELNQRRIWIWQRRRPEILKGRYCKLYRFQALRKRERRQRSFLQGWKSKGNKHRRGYEAPLSPDRSQWIRIDRLRLGKRLRHCRRLYCCRLWLYCGGQNGQGKELGHKVRNRPDDPELGEVQKIHGTENRRRSRPLERDHKLGENLRS